MLDEMLQAPDDQANFLSGYDAFFSFAPYSIHATFSGSNILYLHLSKNKINAVAFLI